MVIKYQGLSPKNIQISNTKGKQQVICMHLFVYTWPLIWEEVAGETERLEEKEGNGVNDVIIF